MYLDFLFAQLWLVIPLMALIITPTYVTSITNIRRKRRDARYQLRKYDESIERYEIKTKEYLARNTD